MTVSSTARLISQRLANAAAAACDDGKWTDPLSAGWCNYYRHRRREFCHFAGNPSPSILKHLLKGRGDWW